MRSCTCVLVVVCVARKLRPCPSYSRCRDCINLVLWRSLYKGGGGTEMVLIVFRYVQLSPNMLRAVSVQEFKSSRVQEFKGGMRPWVVDMHVVLCFSGDLSFVRLRGCPRGC